MSFAAVLRSLREAAGLSQDDLAARARLTTDGVSALERGIRTRPHLRTVRALGDALDLSGAQREMLLAAARPSAAAAQGTARGSVHVLPVPGTPLLGREADLARLEGTLLDVEVRLVTVTGVGGVGKTRLAIEAANTVVPAFPDGVTFVPLAPLVHPTRVLASVQAALGVTSTPSGSIVGALAHRLQDRRMLLVLDNFEHLTSAAPSVADFVAACPSVTVLVTSRARLRLRAEVELPLQPLALPQPGRASATQDAVRRSPACLLLTERVRASEPGFTVTAGNARALSDICHRLGGIPLALELAAPRVRSLGADVVLERLDQAQAWQGARDLPERQQTMAATLAWSHDLLSEDEQVAFRRLAVFSGGFDLEAAESVVGEVLEPSRVLGILESLVEQSLVVVVASERRARYALLEPVRQFARQLLETAPDLPAARAAHARFFLRLAQRAECEFHRSDQLRWLERADLETDNFQSALVWSLTVGDGSTVAEMAWALRLHWWRRGLLGVVGGWMDETLRLELDAGAKVRALLTRAKMAHGQGDFDTARRLFDRAAEIARSNDDLVGRVHGVTLSGLVAIDAGDPAEAIRRLGEAVGLAEGLDDEVLTAMPAIWLGSVLLAEGDDGSARPLLQRGLRSAADRGDRLTMNEILLNQASAAIPREHNAEAARLLKMSATLSRLTQDVPNLAFALEGLAVVGARRATWERCAVLLGAAHGLRQAMPSSYYNYYVPNRALLDDAQSRSRSALGSDAFNKFWSEGTGLDVQGAERYATA